MNERLKKILLIAAFVLIAVGTGYLLYRMFFKPSVPVAIPTPPENVAGQLPTAGGATTTPGQPGVSGVPGLPVTPEIPAVPTGPVVPTYVPPTEVTPPKTVVLSNQVTQAISMSPSGQGVRSYNPNDGKFYRILDDGTQIPLSDQVFYNVSNVTWGNRSDKAVIEYPDNSKILYDFTTNKQVTLPNYWQDFSFSPQDGQIAAKSIGNNDTSRFLVVSNPDGTNAHAVEELGDNQDKVHVSWSPNNQVIAYSFTGDPMGYDQQQIILVGQHQENFKGLVVDGRGFVPAWSPSGNNLLYSVYSSGNDYMPTLWVSGAAGDSINAHRENLQINTWADKCAWQSEQVIICAVPQHLDPGAGLQRELLDNNVPDDIYRIDLQTGTKVNLGTPDGGPTINQMTLSPDGLYMYYTDRNSGQLVRFSVTP